MAVRSMTPDEHARVTRAIRAAEKNTAGEIYCVVARTSDGYFFTASAIVIAFMLMVSLILAVMLQYSWLQIGLSVFASAQILAVAMALAILWWLPGLRVRLVPRRLQYSRAHDNALKQFLARNVHLTTARTGVLVFVSLAERYAEVVADSGINAKVDQDAWDSIVANLIAHARQDRLAEGFIEAVNSVGILLALHFPIGAGDANELDDHLVEI